MKYKIQNNRGEVVAHCETPENAKLVSDALNKAVEGSGTRYIIRTA